MTLTTENDNGIQCEQWRTGFVGTYPIHAYWNCIDGSRATGMEVPTAANELPTVIKNQMYTRGSVTPNNPRVHFYAMTNLAAYNDYFGMTLSTSGGTIYGISTPGYRVSAVFYDSSTTANFRRMTTLHEAGHQMSWIWGNRHNDLVFRDWTQFNTMFTCATIFNAAECVGSSGNDYTLGRLDEQVHPIPAIAPNRNAEIFARVFAHQFSSNTATQFQLSPLLENAYSYVVDMNTQMQTWMTTPPTATQ